MPTFRSNADEIRFYEKQLLEDGLVHTREELFRYVREHSTSGAVFTDGMMSGATRDLVRNSGGLYLSPARGKYQKAPATQVGEDFSAMRAAVLSIFSDTCERLREACTVNLMTVSGDALHLAARVNETVRYLQREMDALRVPGR